MQAIPSVIQRAIDAEAVRAKKLKDAADTPQVNSCEGGPDSENTGREEPKQADDASSHNEQQREPLTARDLQQAGGDKSELRDRRMQMFLGQDDL